MFCGKTVANRQRLQELLFQLHAGVDVRRNKVRERIWSGWDADTSLPLIREIQGKTVIVGVERCNLTGLGGCGRRIDVRFLENFDACSHEWIALGYLIDPEAIPAHGNQIHSAVIKVLHARNPRRCTDREGFGAAADFLSRLDQNDAKGRVSGDAIAEHLFIPLFKDVKRQRSTRKKHRLEREKR